MDIDIERAKALIAQREAIDAELAAIFSAAATKKTIKCGHCNEEGHTARTCPKKATDESRPLHVGKASPGITT